MPALKQLKNVIRRKGMVLQDQVDWIQIRRLLDMLLKKPLNSEYFAEVFSIIVLVAVKITGKLGELNEFMLTGLERLIVSQELAAIHYLDEFFIAESSDRLDLIKHFKVLPLTEGLLDCFMKIVSSRLDDDFDEAWAFLEHLEQTWLGVTKQAIDSSVLGQFVQACRLLSRLDIGQRSLDLTLSIIERLFDDRRLVISDVHDTLSSLAGLLADCMSGADEVKRAWCLTSIVSSVRRLTPASPVDPGRDQSLWILRNLCSFCTELLALAPHEPLGQAYATFLKGFVQPKGLTRYRELCEAYIDYILGIKFSDLSREMLVDVLEHCEGSAELGSFDSSYLDILDHYLVVLSALGPDQCTSVLLQQCTKCSSLFMISQSLLVSSTVFSTKKSFRSAVRFKTLAFFKDYQQRHQSPQLAELLDRQLYPQFNSILSCTLQEGQQLGVQFEFHCFALESKEMLLDLVAMASWIQVKHGLHPFAYFLSVSNPNASSFAYGRTQAHRLYCFQLYMRWNRLSSGAFATQHRDMMGLTILHVLLEGLESSNVTIREIIQKDDNADLLQAALDWIGRTPLKGVLQYVPILIDETSSISDWKHFSSRLCGQLGTILSFGLVHSGRVTMEMVFDLMLRKEEDFKLTSGPFHPSDPIFLAMALAFSGQPGKHHESAMTSITIGLVNVTTDNLHLIVKRIGSRPILMELYFIVLMRNFEFVEFHRSVLLATCELIFSFSGETIPLFHPTLILPDCARPFYAVFVWAAIKCRRSIVNMTSWLAWLLPEYGGPVEISGSGKEGPLVDFSFAFPPGPLDPFWLLQNELRPPVAVPLHLSKIQL